MRVDLIQAFLIYNERTLNRKSLCFY